MTAYVKKYGSGHYFNIGKINNVIWYIDPQSLINTGQYTLYNKIKLISKINNPIINILFVLDKYQAEIFTDFVIEANYGNPYNGWWKNKH